MTLLPTAAEIFGEELSKLVDPLGGAAAAIALLGLLLLLPLYVTQRRDVVRLLRWQEQDPAAGEPETPPAGTGFIEPATGSMSAAAARVTSERPALARIGTAERAAIDFEQAPFWRRVIDRGPRHPLVASLIALLLAGGIFAGVALFLRADDEGGKKGERGMVVPSDVEVVVVNASSSSGLGGLIADGVEANDFIVAGTTASSEQEDESAVLYAPGSKKEGRTVAKSLEIPRVLEFDQEAEAAAEGATVVVLVGEDLAQASDDDKKK